MSLHHMSNLVGVGVGNEARAAPTISHGFCGDSGRRVNHISRNDLWPGYLHAHLHRYREQHSWVVGQESLAEGTIN